MPSRIVKLLGNVNRFVFAGVIALLGSGIVAVAQESVDAATEGALSDVLSVPEEVQRLPALKAEMERLIGRMQEAPPYHWEDVLELAYLYHANGYGVQASRLYDWLIARSEEAEERARLNYLAADAIKGKGDSAAATAYLEAATRHLKGYPLAYARLGEARLKSNDFAAAESLFREALSLDNTLSPARLGLARLLMRKEQFREAIQELGVLLRSDPDNYNAQGLLARALSEIGDEERALMVRQSFGQSSTPPIEDPWLDPVNAAILDPQRLDFLFLDHFLAGEFDKALPYLDKMERIDPGNARYCRYRGIVFMEMKQFGEATAVFRKGLELGGDDKELYPLLVQSLMRNGMTAEAEAAAREGLAESEPTGELMLELARALVDRKALAEALQVLTSALELSPYEVETHLLRGRVGLWLDEVEIAKDSLGMVQQLAPSNHVVLVRAALVYMEAGRFADAVPILEQARSVAPSDKDANELLADAFVQLGKAAYAKGEADGALEYLGRALFIDPLQLEALSAKAQYLIELRRFELAEAAMRDLVDSRAGSATTLLIYGDLLYQNGKRSEAREIWTQALERAANDGNQPELRRKLLQRLNG